VALIGFTHARGLDARAKGVSAWLSSGGAGLSGVF